MKRPWLVQVIVCLFLILSLAACRRPDRPESAVEGTAVSKTGHGPLRVVADGDRALVGPFAHENLSVYLVVADDPEDAQFITLAEGLESGEVVVSEKDDAEVDRLMLENRSSKPLFLQEGDRLRGGNQDRMVYASLVVPPRSGPREVPSFCIEQSRWSAGAQGHAFSRSGSAALSPKSVRLASKVSKSQHEVWRNVSRTKGSYAANLGSSNSNSSLNEALDSPQAKRAAQGYEDALGSVLAAHPEAIGVVFAVDGKIEEADVYAGPTLFSKVYPRLLQSFAMDAAASSDPSEQRPAIGEFLRGRGTTHRNEDLDADNRLEVHDLGSRFRSRTLYRGSLVHEQFMAREADAS